MQESVVLGSEGLIGRQLRKELQARGVVCHNFDLVLSADQDLRQEDCQLLASVLSRVDVVYFLAFDVGGSRYLAAKDQEYDFLENNARLLVNTFMQIRKHNVRTLFASSQMSHLPQTSYGLLKALGERLCSSVGGNSVRLWNVYGDEELGDKSHVIPDFIDMALSDGLIRMRTTGQEKRDFMHVRDCANLLADIGQGASDPLAEGETIDVATCQWTSIWEVAEIIARDTNSEIIRGKAMDTFAGNDNHSPEPPSFVSLREFISIESGIRELVQIAKGRRNEVED